MAAVVGVDVWVGITGSVGDGVGEKVFAGLAVKDAVGVIETVGVRVWVSVGE